MKLLKCSVAVGLLAAVAACSHMPDIGGHASRTTAPVAAQPTVAPDTVRQVQAKLHDAGYYKQGPVDGVWGAGTQSAVRSFQRDHNLGSSGELDVPTLQALNLTGPSQVTNDHAVTEPARNDPDANPPPADTNPSAPAR